MERLKISRIVAEAARELGYPILKPEQLDITVTFVEGRDVFIVFYQLAMERACVTAFCPTLSTG